MTTIPSKHNKPASLPDPIVVLTSTLVIGALLFWGAHTSSFFPSPGRADQTQNWMGISAGSKASFAEDLRYWEANCSHGRVSDSACRTIVAKAQSCEISAASAYCSAYKTYIRQFFD